VTTRPASRTSRLLLHVYVYRASWQMFPHRWTTPGGYGRRWPLQAPLAPVRLGRRAPPALPASDKVRQAELASGGWILRRICSAHMLNVHTLTLRYSYGQNAPLHAPTKNGNKWLAFAASDSNALAASTEGSWLFRPPGDCWFRHCRSSSFLAIRDRRPSCCPGRHKPRARVGRYPRDSTL
jgi:hypothetical protein